MGTKTITMYISDVDGSEIPESDVLQMEVLHPDGSKQILDLSRKNYMDMKLLGLGSTQKKRGRKPGSTKSGNGKPDLSPPADQGELIEFAVGGIVHNRALVGSMFEGYMTKEQPKGKGTQHIYAVPAKVLPELAAHLGLIGGGLEVGQTADDRKVGRMITDAAKRIEGMSDK